MATSFYPLAHLYHFSVLSLILLFYEYLYLHLRKYSEIFATFCATWPVYYSDKGEISEKSSRVVHISRMQKDLTHK